ncbi:MAG: DUF368 domain-containing protein [Planctomycetota bacterium]|nr:MAG: DUF368 domain-containing protein [Planctomycetota bacterium]
MKVGNMNDRQSPKYRYDLLNWFRGLCMGAADIVPGVSGGTIALLLGHYERLVTAISHVDLRLFRLLRTRRWREAAEHMDLRFLIALAVGIATGIVALASLMHHLLEHHLSGTYAVFNGLVLASVFLVVRRIGRWTAPRWVLFALGALVAFQLCRLTPMHTPLTPVTAFLSATLAICAMILPGISGAFVLLLLGVYHPVTELIKGLPRGQITVEGLLLVGLFLAGCATGLLLFSRLLRWLLEHRHDATLCALVGLMLGSLYRIWPFQAPTPSTAELEFKLRHFEHHMPGSAGEALVAVGLATIAGAATYALEKLAERLAPELPSS